MMVEPSVSRDDTIDRYTLIAGTVFGLIMGAIVGAIFLPLLYGFLSGMFDWDRRPPHLRLYCSLAGAGIGAVKAFSSGLKQVRRRRRTRSVAESLGLEYSADLDDELEDELIHLLGDTGMISISNAVHRNVDSARFIVADMQHRKSGGSDSNSHVTHQTIAFFTSDQLHFPSFEMQPEGMLLNLMTNVLGIEDIDFDDYPEFSAQYHLAGTHPQQIRQLFDGALLRHFTQHSGWQVKASGNRLLMFQPRKRCDPAQLAAFINGVMEAFGLFMSASYAVQDAQDVATAAGEPASAAEPSEDSPPIPGILAAMAQAMMVSSDELDRFLSAPAPRQIPANIMRQRIGSGSLIAALMGCIFLAAGTILASVAFLGMDGPLDEERVVLMILGTVFPLVGGTMAFFAFRYRRRNHQLLRHGQVTQGKVEAVERTGTMVNNQRQYRLKVRFADGLGQRTSTCNIYGKVAEEARRRHQEQVPVRILYDRNAPQRILWADAFALAKI